MGAEDPAIHSPWFHFISHDPVPVLKKNKGLVCWLLTGRRIFSRRQRKSAAIRKALRKAANERVKSKPCRPGNQSFRQLILPVHPANTPASVKLSPDDHAGSRECFDKAWQVSVRRHRVTKQPYRYLLRSIPQFQLLIYSVGAYIFTIKLLLICGQIHRTFFLCTAPFLKAV